MNVKSFKIAGSVITMAVLLTSCTSTSVMGLSRSAYVDEEIRQLKNTDAEVQRLEAELDDLRSLTDDIQRIDEQIDDLEGGLADAVEADREIRSMAEEFQQRLDSIPRETLMELKSAIETYLAATADE
jgi:septal ring factor EnvC (AmiA/AmiB activator)